MPRLSCGSPSRQSAFSRPLRFESSPGPNPRPGSPALRAAPRALVAAARHSTPRNNGVIGTLETGITRLFGIAEMLERLQIWFAFSPRM
jgi:hypothetical protein